MIGTSCIAELYPNGRPHFDPAQPAVRDSAMP
jgi:hypothetical protein